MNFTLGVYLSQIKTNRAAAIPYLIKNIKGEMKIFFLLAIDSKTSEITDLGGGVKKNECSLIATLREFKEESNEIFEDLYDQVNFMTTKIAIIHNKMSALFIPLDEKWFDIAIEKFELKKNNKKTYREVSGLLWIDQDDFFNLITTKNNKMWNRIRNFYRANYNSQLLEALKIIYFM